MDVRGIYQRAYRDSRRNMRIDESDFNKAVALDLLEQTDFNVNYRIYMRCRDEGNSSTIPYFYACAMAALSLWWREGGLQK